MTYKQLEEAIRIWAEDQEIVRALAVIGSRARADHAADAWSDLDFIFFVTDLQEIAQDSSWLNTFGQVVLKVLQRTGAGDPEWLVLYGGGLKVDFVLAVAKRSFPEDLFGPRFGIVSRRGARILVDKENARPEQFSVEFAGQGKPEPAEFETALQLFWMTAHRAAAMIGRGDLWRARQIMDVALRRQLTQLLAWHAQARGGAGLDTWYDGRFMNDWVDPRALAALPQLFTPSG